MKKLGILVLFVAFLIPQAGNAATMAELEAKRLQLMEQIIVLLKAKIEYLLAERARQGGAGGVVLGIATSTVPTTPTTTEPVVVKKKRSGGGGGGGGSSRNSDPEPAPIPALVVSATESDNTFTVTSNTALDITLVRITLATSVPEDVETPGTLTLRAKISDASTLDIPLVKEGETLAYSADMRARLGVGQSYTGEFEVIFGDDLALYTVPYTTYIETNGVTRSLTMQNDGVVKLKLARSSEDLDGTFIPVFTENYSTRMMFAFELENNGGVPANVKQVNISVSTGPVLDASEIISNVYLVTTQGEFEGDAETDSLEFSDVDMQIAPQDYEPIGIVVEFYPIGSYSSGQQINFSVSSDGVFAYHDETEELVDFEGLISGDTHTLMLSGSALLTDFDSDVDVIENSEGVTTDDEGSYALDFDVTSYDSELYINPLATRGEDIENEEGLNFLVIDQNGAVVTNGATVSTLTSSADEENGRYMIGEGETETFTLRVEFDPGTSGDYRIQLYSLNYNSENDDPNVQQYFEPEEDYRSTPLTINN